MKHTGLCRHCESTIRANAVICPHCGYLRLPLLKLVIIGLALAGLGAAVAIYNNQARQPTPRSGPTQPPDLSVMSPLQPSPIVTQGEADDPPVSVGALAGEADTTWIGYYTLPSQKSARYHWNGIGWTLERLTSSGWHSEATTMAHPRTLLQAGVINRMNDPLRTTDSEMAEPQQKSEMGEELPGRLQD